ncbi:hypothetical protein [Dokdonella koreensis]|uniref:hypothetical protein n=1 Tax=Dokdonella koreensis TaxID=323415 RepID=UPI00123742C6|nr:hypothetical protein [Dokdonella koreensis]
MDLIVRAVAATLWLLLAWRLVWAAGGERVVRLFVPLALGLVGFLAGTTVQPALLLPGTAAVVAGVLSGSAAVFLWWFCLMLFDDAFRLGPMQAVVAVARCRAGAGGAARRQPEPHPAARALRYLLHRRALDRLAATGPRAAPIGELPRSPDRCGSRPPTCRAGAGARTTGAWRARSGMTLAIDVMRDSRSATVAAWRGAGRAAVTWAFQLRRAAPDPPDASGACLSSRWFSYISIAAFNSPM